MNYNMGQGSYGFGTAPGSRIYGFSSPYRQPNSTRDLTPIETRNMLIVNARKEIRNKLNMWKSETTTKAADKEKDMTRESKKERRRTTANIEGHDQNGNSDLSATKADQPGKGQVSHSANNASEGDAKAASMTVPDPDFHDFDQDRTESSFGDNEVWAAYDDDDGMPRFYALISKVMSRKPFKLRISWLNSRTNSEFSTIDWVGSVYKNWSSDWNGQTPEEVIHKYEMVTVLDDYSEEQGVSVAPLVKVVGFKTVFRPNLDPEMIKRIPKEEMFRFSHRVPKYSLTGLEAQNAPKGCLELDPAATPLELLQVITESNEVQTEPKKANADEDVLQSVPSSSSGEIAPGANAAQAVNIAESK
ncbi:UNVERIFIED_CONTAM: hypothetical protein Sradi_6625800 [Sesamum radiatum]|uniref:DUF3444 domain-containing protein n=1 Tax=Sesamum radiatum TaxID=300843 RepID=A0AAW2JYG6_SESRA